MKKSKVLATTTLTGALLFTGVGATHNAHAAEGLTDTQKQNIVNQYIQDNNINATPDSRVASADNLVNVPEGYTPVGFAEKRNQAPSFVYVNDKTGEIIDKGAGHHELISQDSRNNTQTDQTTTSNTTQDTTNNNTQSTDNTQAATNNETTNNNTTAATDNNVSTQENNTQSTQSNEAQSTAQALPETGEQSNSGLVTIVASVLLAAGSLLAFRRTSNSK